MNRTSNDCLTVFYVVFKAGEALGAIGSPEVTKVLEKHLKDDRVEVCHFLQLIYTLVCSYSS